MLQNISGNINQPNKSAEPEKQQWKKKQAFPDEPEFSFEWKRASARIPQGRKCIGGGSCLGAPRVTRHLRAPVHAPASHSKKTCPNIWDIRLRDVAHFPQGRDSGGCPDTMRGAQAWLPSSQKIPQVEPGPGHPAVPQPAPHARPVGVA